MADTPTAERPRLRAVIVDDEPAAREAIRTFLDDEPRVEVVGEAGNGNEAVEVVREERPDLLFLDVQMPDRDGFAVLDLLGDDVPPGVVFVTAHDEHAVRAFEVHALDYVLKPFGRPRFEAAVERALGRIEAESALSLRRTLESMAGSRGLDPAEAAEAAAIELADDDGADGGGPGVGGPGGGGAGTGGAATGGRPTRLGVRAGSKTILVPVDEIDWVEADGDYARIHAGDRAHLVAERMNALEALLGPERFLRIHRSVIVNLARVRELHRDADGGGAVVLDSGVRLRVARRRWEELERALGL